ncbi:MAG: site-specific integrase [Thiolinea sp.]
MVGRVINQTLLAGAFRRSELGALAVDDIFVTDAGLRVEIRQSKTDQEAEGQQIAIPDGKMQAVNVLFDWLGHAGIAEGYVFRGFYKGGRTIRTNKLSGQAVADIVKAYALKAGFNPAEFAGHSLRSGFVTSAAENGANLFRIMDVSRHKNVQAIREYVRHAEAFKDHADSAFL